MNTTAAPEIIASYADGSGPYTIARHGDILLTMIGEGDYAERLYSRMTRTPLFDDQNHDDYVLTDGFASAMDFGMDADEVVWIGSEAYTLERADEGEVDEVLVTFDPSAPRVVSVEEFPMSGEGHVIHVAPMMFAGVECPVRERYADDGIHFERYDGARWVEFDFHPSDLARVHRGVSSSAGLATWSGGVA